MLGFQWAGVTGVTLGELDDFMVRGNGAMPQSGTGVSIERVGPAFAVKFG